MTEAIVGTYLFSVIIIIVVYILVILRIRNSEGGEAVVSQRQIDYDRVLLDADPMERRKILKQNDK